MKSLSKNNSTVFLLIAGFFFGLQSCKKEIGNTDPTPSIEFISVNKTEVAEFRDSLVFRIKYRDGDGDLGENNDAIRNIFLTDSRNSVKYEFRIPQLAPLNDKLVIEGNLDITLGNTAIVGSGNSEVVSYNIQVKDRAGNLSNTVTSPVIRVVR